MSLMCGEAWLNTGSPFVDDVLSRYDWSKAPKWAMWACTDKNGESFWCNQKPIIVSIVDCWGSQTPYNDDFMSESFCSMNNCCDDWKDSLEQRPVF